MSGAEVGGGVEGGRGGKERALPVQARDPWSTRGFKDYESRLHEGREVGGEV